MEIKELKQIAKEKGITYKTIAQKSGISEGTLKNLFSQPSPNPTLKTLQAIENALGINDQDEEYIPEDKLYRDLLEAGLTEDNYKKLSPKERKKILKTLKAMLEED